MQGRGVGGVQDVEVEGFEVAWEEWCLHEAEHLRYLRTDREVVQCRKGTFLKSWAPVTDVRGIPTSLLQIFELDEGQVGEKGKCLDDLARQGEPRHGQLS